MTGGDGKKTPFKSAAHFGNRVRSRSLAKTMPVSQILDRSPHLVMQR